MAVIAFLDREGVVTIHGRIPAILRRKDHARLLSSEEDPSDLLAPFRAKLMTNVADRHGA